MDSSRNQRWEEVVAKTTSSKYFLSTKEEANSILRAELKLVAELLEIHSHKPRIWSPAASNDSFIIGSEESSIVLIKDKISGDEKDGEDIDAWKNDSIKDPLR